MPILFLIVFIDLVGFGIIIPLLPFYAQYFGASAQTVTLLMATYSFMQFLSAPLLGGLSDRIGRRPVLVLGLVGTVAAYLVMAFANSLWMLFLARAVAGALAGNIAAAQAYVADSTEPKMRARGMGWLGAAFGLGFMFGPLIGGVLAGSDPDAVDYASPPLAAAGFALIAAVLTVVALPEPSAPASGAPRPGLARRGWLTPIAVALRQPTLAAPVVLFFLIVLVFAGMEATFALWAAERLDWGPRQVGYLFALVGVVAITVQGGAVGPLNARLGEMRLTLLGLGLLIGGFLCLAMAIEVVLTAIAAGLLAAGFSLTNPALHGLISRRAGADVQGASLGVAQSAGSLARIIGPAAAGAVYSLIGPDWPYLLGALILIGALVAAARLARQVPYRA